MTQPQPQPAPPAAPPAPGPVPGPAPQQPQPVSPQVQQQPAPAAPPAQYPPQVQQQVPPQVQQVPYPPQPGQQPATGTDHGYPESTPVDQMTPQQQVAYWRTQARKHEQRVKERNDYDDLKEKARQYDQLAASTQTDHQRAIADAAATARTQALTEAGGKLVDAWVRAAAAGRLDDERVNALLTGLDRRAFVNSATGEVDADRVTAYVHSVLPAQVPGQYQVATAAPGQQPVMGPPPGYAAPAPGQPVYPQPVYGQPVYPGQPGYPAQPAAPGQPVYPGQQMYQQPGYAAPGQVPGQVPDFGQGTPQTPRPSGLAAGRAVAAERFGDQARSVAAQNAARPTQS